MIDAIKLAELQKHWKGFPSKLNGNITTEDMVEMFDTIETLLKENAELKEKLESETEMYEDPYYSGAGDGFDEVGC